MTPKELAKECNVSLTTVYRVAKIYGRLPTAEELKQHAKKVGRPRKYNY